MDEILEEQKPEFYEIIPEYNRAGRLCNYGSGKNAKAKVPADEWERFNHLAGRQHEIIDGIVVYNSMLEPCIPDDDSAPEQITSIEQQITNLQLAIVELYEGSVY